MITVYACSAYVRNYFADFSTEEAAYEYCRNSDWTYVDQNGFVWVLEIGEEETFFTDDDEYDFEATDADEPGFHLYEVIYWIPGNDKEENRVTTEGYDDKNTAHIRLTALCVADPQKVGYVFSTCGNRRIMTIGVGLE